MIFSLALSAFEFRYQSLYLIKRWNTTPENYLLVDDQFRNAISKINQFANLTT